MPIYEYECTKCGFLREVMQGFSDPPLTRCESCRGKLRKLISHSAFHLKGSGWYVTDYASKSSSGKTSESGSGNSSPTNEAGSEKPAKETGAATKSKEAAKE